MIRFQASCLLVACTLMTKAQDFIGHYRDLDAKPLHGYYDKLDYEPNNVISFTHNSDSFEKGKVYYKSGKTEETLIKYQDNKIKVENGDKVITLKPDEILGVTIGIDSFFVAKNFEVQGSLGLVTTPAPEFMQYVATVNGVLFAKHYNFVNMGNNPVQVSYHFKKGGATKWTRFPKKKKKFVLLANELFQSAPHIHKLLLSGSLDQTDVMMLIKSTEYHEKFLHKDTIFYDQNWQETQSDVAHYYANIIEYDNGGWVLRYANKSNKKLYEGRYSRFFPHQKDGAFKSFYPDGSLRKVTTHQNGELIEVQTYYQGGQLHERYRFSSMVMNQREITRIRLLEILDKNGDPFPNSENWLETIELGSDEKLVNEYSKKEVTSSYLLRGNKKTYLISNPYYSFKINKIQKALNSHFNLFNFEDAAFDNAQGSLFVKVDINEKGEVITSKVLNGLHPDIDEELARFADDKLKRIGFKPYKVNNEKVQATFIIPFRFGINKFYRRPYYYDHHWHMHWMMQQQMNFNNMNIPTPPPTRF